MGKLTAITVSMCLACVAAGTATAQAAKRAGEVFGNWEIKQYVDKMSDQTRCTLWYRKAGLPVFIEDAGNIIFVLGPGRTPVSYRYRVGTSPATEIQPSSMYEKDMHVVQVWLPDDKLGEAKSLLVRGSTILGESFEREVDLTGLRAARAKLLERCGKSTS